MRNIELDIEVDLEGSYEFRVRVPVERIEKGPGSNVPEFKALVIAGLAIRETLLEDYPTFPREQLDAALTNSSDAFVAAFVEN